MDIPTLVAEIRHQTTVARLDFRGVADINLPKECFAAGSPPVHITPELVFDFHIRRLALRRFTLRLPLVVPGNQMQDFCFKVQLALWNSLHSDPLWVVRDLPIDLKSEGRIVARTDPSKIAFLIDDIRLESSSRRWTVTRVAFDLVHVGAFGRKLIPEFLEEWEEGPPRWVPLDPR